MQHGVRVPPLEQERFSLHKLTNNFDRFKAMSPPTFICCWDHWKVSFDKPLSLCLSLILSAVPWTWIIKHDTVVCKLAIYAQNKVAVPSNWMPKIRKSVKFLKISITKHLKQCIWVKKLIRFDYFPSARKNRCVISKKRQTAICKWDQNSIFPKMAYSV